MVADRTSFKGGVDRGEVIMVGDNYVKDVEGAASYGFQTCWITPIPKGGEGDNEKSVETYRATSVVEFLAQVGLL